MEPYLTPILLRAFGRSGTTYVMHALACSEATSFEKRYPFEERELTYLVRVAETIAGAGAQAMPREAVLAGSDARLGACPYLGSNRYLHAGQESVKRLFKDLWLGYSREALKLRPATYYAEKVANDVPPLVNEVLPAKNILLVRDPRGEMLSIMKFNRQRGYNGFGWLPDDDPERFALRLCTMRRHFLSEAARVEENPRRMLLRYEDIVVDAERFLLRLQAFLDAEIDTRLFHERLGNFRYHMTSESALRSVDLWRDELPPEAAEIIQRGLASELQDLGYA
ncbi:MAG: hypothetical protein C1943_12025 [Halochromatium sp.]|nr:hypothetical protein [Halochromatium sp.]